MFSEYIPAALIVLCIVLASSSARCPQGLVQDPSARYCQGNYAHIEFKGATSQGFCFVQVNSVLKSFLSTFTHITYKGAPSQGFCFVQVNSVLKPFLSAFAHNQNAPAEFFLFPKKM